MYTLRYLDTTIQSENDLDGLITRLAIDGISSDLTDSITEITEHYDYIDLDTLDGCYTAEQIMRIKSMPIDDLSSYGYMWFRNLVDGDKQAIEEFRRLL